MGQEVDPINHELGRHRAYLCVLARLNLDRRLWSLIDPSDVVQRTLLDAHRKREQHRGNDLTAWLRRCLLNDLKDAARKFRPIADRERHLQQAVEQSSCRIEASLQAEDPSPSQQAELHDQLRRLAEALTQLPEAERLAVELHYLHAWPCSEVAAHLGRSRPAVAGLLRQGKKRLRKLLEKPE